MTGFLLPREFSFELPSHHTVKLLTTTVFRLLLSGENGGRTNYNGVDLNRNFPDQFAPRSDSIQPETLAIMRWIESAPWVLSANLHGGSVVASYPFDGTQNQNSVYSISPDDDVFVTLAVAYAQNHPIMNEGKVGFVCFSCGLILYVSI